MSPTILGQLAEIRDLLDEEGKSLPAVHLQMAIDTLSDEKPD